MAEIQENIRSWCRYCCSRRGHGKKRLWLSNYHLALWKDEKLVEVCKTFKGLTNKEMNELTKTLLRLKIGNIDRGITVKPKIVVKWNLRMRNTL